LPIASGKRLILFFLAVVLRFPSRRIKPAVVFSVCFGFCVHSRQIAEFGKASESSPPHIRPIRPIRGSPQPPNPLMKTSSRPPGTLTLFHRCSPCVCTYECVFVVPGILPENLSQRERPSHLTFRTFELHPPRAPSLLSSGVMNGEATRANAGLGLDCPWREC